MTVKFAKNKKIITITLLILILLGVGLAVYVSISRAAAQAEADKLAAEAQARIELSIQADNADKEFFDFSQQQVQRLKEAENAARLEEARAERDKQVAAAQEKLEASEGKVLDNEVRDTLFASIKEAEDASHFYAIQEKLELMSANVTKTEQAVEEWDAEQTRIAEEARRAEEARIAEEARRAEETRRAEAARQAQSSGPAATPQSSNTSQSSQSPPARSNSSSNKSSAGKTEKAKAILARHGCGSLSVTWDDPRLAGWNGAYLVGEGRILLNSRIANSSRLNYIVAHECAHHLQFTLYGNDQYQLEQDMNAIYGGSGTKGFEQNADCITQRWGYSEHFYTTNCSGERGSAAQAVMNSRKPATTS